MKTSTIKLTAVFFLLAMFCSLHIPVFSQTIMNVPPRQLAEVVSQQLFVNDERQPGDPNVAILKIDSVLCDGVTIGYLFYYNNNRFALVPKVKEINPLFAVSRRTSITEKNARRLETFLKEELERRYLALVYQENSSRYIARNEQMWHQLLSGRMFYQKLTN